MRRGRRYRNTPYRACRSNRGQLKAKNRMPPSTRARWQWKLRVIKWLQRLYPISLAVVENIEATTKKGKRRWNKSFSPLMVGKTWFYTELERMLGGTVHLVKGHETAETRAHLGLFKSKQKMSGKWDAHCVDSFTLAWLGVGGDKKPDNLRVMHLVPLRFHRRQLHRLQFESGGIRKPYGGTMSLGFKRGSWVKHPKHGLCYVGGNLKGRLSLHDLYTGKRLTQSAKIDSFKLLTLSSWRLGQAA